MFKYFSQKLVRFMRSWKKIW